MLLLHTRAVTASQEQATDLKAVICSQVKVTDYKPRHQTNHWNQISQEQRLPLLFCGCVALLLTLNLKSILSESHT